jgi:DNA-binding NtrC family response regulator
MTRPTVLIVEDDLDLREALAGYLDANDFAAAQAADASDAIDRLKNFAYDALVIDLHLPDASGMEVLCDAIVRYPRIRAVVITGFGEVADAVTAMKRGAIDFLTKPFELSQLAQILRQSIAETTGRQAEGESEPEVKRRFQFDHIIGCDTTMQRFFSTLELVAPMNSTVLIEGETGTGKELVARTIHDNSPRAEHRFVAFNAAAIPDGLAEAELFGHVKGAFTGAIASRTGRFELAHKGTLFIDEVSSMSPPLQAKLLRTLQEREVERVGESRPMKLDIRVIAATNTDLRKLVKDGAFREDLFYRLNVIPVRLPPLRERREDVPLLAQHFAKKSCRDNGVALKPISQEALRILMAYDWPGNVRQFENAIEHAVAMSLTAAEIGPDALPAEVHRPGSPAVPSIAIPDEGINFTSVVSGLERDLILRCLEKTGGNKRQAARLLNLSRTTFIDKLQRLSLPAV